jgi:arylsulfatase A-like enzyme
MILGLACAPQPEHDHVADPYSLDDFNTAAPTWVEDFAKEASQAEANRPHVLLISLDTLRADHLGAWGYDRPTSPFLDELARFGVRFDQAFSHSPKTAPSHMSVFTGVYPRHHGAHFAYNTTPPTAFAARSDLATLPEVMREAGYRTAAWTGGGQVSRTAGFARGFDHYKQNFAALNTKKMGKIFKWFEGNADQPCFIFLHTYQIHDPYLPPPPYNEIFTSDSYEGWVIGDKLELLSYIEASDYERLHRAFWRKTGPRPDPAIVDEADLQHLRGLYDGNIRFADDVLHGFFQNLANVGLLTNTLVIVFSDHGEEFLEHGGFLHEKLYRETLHVPLIFFWPAGLPQGLVVDTQVPLMDLTPTLLELAGLEPMIQSDASTLLPMLSEAGHPEPRPVFSEEPWVHPTHHRSFRDGSRTVYDYGTGRVELFDAVDDPRESLDLAVERPNDVLGMIERMAAFLAALTVQEQGPAEPATELTEEETEALRALGYVE